MLGQRTPEGSGLHGRFDSRISDLIGFLRGFQLVEPQFELLQLGGGLLALRAEDLAAQLLDDELQVFDLMRLRRQLPVLLDQQGLQRFDIECIEIGKRSGDHVRSMA